MTNEQENTVSTAILVDPGLDTPLSPVLGELPIALLPVATKPLLQHWLERISAMGTQRVTILSAHFPEKVRQFVADGSRWGLAVEVVVYRPEMDAQGLRALLADISGTDPTLVANLATWPMPELAQYLTPAARVEGQDESAMCWQINARPFVEKLELDHNDRPVVTVPADAYQDCNDLEGYWQLNMRLLSGELNDPLPYGFEAAPGVWAASNCKLDSSVSILGSVVIGESAIVARRALLGHNAVIGAHSVVEQGASIVDSVVFPRSFIGSYMQIGEAIVAGDVIYRVADGLLLHVNDPEIVARRE